MALPDRPLIVQGDFTLLLEVDHPQHAAVRDRLARFAELVKAPEHLHTWRLTPLSAWNAAASGMTADEMVAALQDHSRYPVPAHVAAELYAWAARYGRLRLSRDAGALRLDTADRQLAAELEAREALRPLLGARLSETAFHVRSEDRGRLKQTLIHLGHPVEDHAGYTPGEPLAVRSRATTAAGQPWALRAYQHEAVEVFYAGGASLGGSGVVVLPCGAGKTVVGIGVLERVGASTLVITTGVTAARQWIAEILDKTDLAPDQVGEYTGERKEIRPVTVTTYQALTWRAHKEAPFEHLALFDRRDWGLVIYDEVHLLPAPVFQVTAGIQARRRLGLTATLVREDGRQDDVFALIGPRRFDVPWREMEASGWIAKARCTELRVPMSADLWLQYNLAPDRERFRVASENPAKLPLVAATLARHPGAPALVIGMYLEQLAQLAERLGAPLLTGQTAQRTRERLFEGFRRGEIPVLVVSKVANFAVDLPDAALAIQVSGTFGSRQEEAQRLGRILRPKAGENQAWFYSLVTRDSVEQDCALHRQLFLVEQGYRYGIEDAP